jgi:UDP-2,3-diacylglucosamine pyrophosphatase LpxH
MKFPTVMPATNQRQMPGTIQAGWRAVILLAVMVIVFPVLISVFILNALTHDMPGIRQPVKLFMNWLSKGTKMYYVTGNHDEMVRKFVGFKMGSLRIVNKVVLELQDGKKAWIFHGDVFDVTMQHSKWLAKLGAIGYDMLILINRFANFISEKIFKKGKLSLSKRIKNSVKSAVKFINDFEQTAADIGISNHYDYVVCGHIHQPDMRELKNSHGSIMYLNSGDWIENLTALEYANGEWKIYKYSDAEFEKEEVEELEESELSNDQLFDNLLQEFNLMRS